MKSKLITSFFLIIILLSLTGCGNTRTLSCTATSSEDGRITTSDLEIEIGEKEIEDMTLILNVKLPKEEQSSKQAMMYQMRQKTNQVTATADGIRAVFDMGNSYFDSFGITKDVSYSELKQVLELQGYTCKK